MGWVLTAGLQNLRRQVDAAFPDRDHTSDGTIGDTAHQAETSGHNPDDTPGSRPEWNGDPDSTPEVRAWDMDSDLRHPGVTAQDLVDHLRRLPGLSSVIRYMIYDRRMYHARDGFNPTPYTGSSPHTEHIHFSGAWTQAADDNTRFDFHLEELVMTVDEIVKAVLAAPVTVGNETWTLASAIGYAARKAYLIDQQLPDSGAPTAAQIADEVAARLKS